MDSTLTEKKDKFIYPATETLLAKIDPRLLYKLKELRKNYHLDPLKIYDKRLRPYQNEDVDFMIKRKCSANFNEQRLGKTPIALVAMKEIGFNKLLIIAPKSTLINWKKEVKYWINEDAYVINKETKLKRKIIYREQKIIICSHFLITQDLYELRQSNIDAIILDEAHHIRNFKGVSARGPAFSKAIIQLSYTVKKKIALSGTPSPNYSYNIFPILHFLYPNLFTSYWNFILYYYNTEVSRYNMEGDEKLEIQNFKDGKAKELQEFLDFISIQRKRKDYMQWLPDVDDIKISLPMTKHQKTYYDTLLERYEIPKTDIICQGHLDLMIRLRQLATDPNLLKLNAKSNKEEYILQYIEDYPEEQIFIVSEFTSFLKLLHEKIPNSKLLIGETTLIERNTLQEDFNKRLFPILLGNIQVAKEGIKLEKGNTIIFVDHSLTYTDNNQIKDRIIPTSKEVAATLDFQKIIRLESINSIDEYISSMLELKKTSSDIINNFKEQLKNKPFGI